MAGGSLPTTYMEGAQLKRIIPPELQTSEGTIQILDLNLNELKSNKFDFSLNDGDKIHLEGLLISLQTRLKLKVLYYGRVSILLSRNESV